MKNEKEIRDRIFFLTGLLNEKGLFGVAVKNQIIGQIRALSFVLELEVEK